MSWFDELQQASFRGVPFAVLGGESRFGRRVAVHQYPMRDKPYIEDLGRSTRRINLGGFLVENSLVYGGGSALAQRDAMVAAAETPGPGTLVHPTLGTLQVSLPDGALGIIERWDQGRYFELNFGFIESGDRLFPSVTPVTGSLLGSLADALDLNAALDFVSTLTRAVNLGLGIVQGVINMGHAIVGTVVGVIAGFQVLVGQAARDATSLLNLASLLTGNFGRYANANVSSAFQQGGPPSSSTLLTIDTLTAQGAEGRAAIATASAALGVTAAMLDAATVPALPPAAQGLTAALFGTIANPGDAVRIFGGLGAYAPNVAQGNTGQVLAGQQLAQAATGALLRRAALGALARAVAAYQPTSYNDAASVRSTVVAAIDAEILVAGDAGDDNSYTALRALRQSVVSVLTAVGASLAPLQTFTFNAPQPALALANRLYQDASRSDQLVAQANPVHPAFMPARFQALAS